MHLNAVDRLLEDLGGKFADYCSTPLPARRKKLADFDRLELRFRILMTDGRTRTLWLQFHQRCADLTRTECHQLAQAASTCLGEIRLHVQAIGMCRSAARKPAGVPRRPAVARLAVVQACVGQP